MKFLIQIRHVDFVENSGHALQSQKIDPRREIFALPTPTTRKQIGTKKI
jgi:hypothetical protein